MEQGEVEGKGRERRNVKIPPRGFSHKSWRRTSGFKKELDPVQENSSCEGHHLLPPCSWGIWGSMVFMVLYNYNMELPDFYFFLRSMGHNIAKWPTWVSFSLSLSPRGSPKSIADFYYIFKITQIDLRNHPATCFYTGQFIDLIHQPAALFLSQRYIPTKIFLISLLLTVVSESKQLDQSS